MSKLWFMVGLPASGKSTWAETHKEELNAVVHSSDSIRAELGNVNDQTKNELVFNILHKRVKEDLLNGKNVIYDSTGLKRKNRIHLISNVLKDIPCEKICILFATPIEICKKNNANRDRKVPEEVIERMYKNFEVPCYSEKWDDIQIEYWDYENEGLKFDFNQDVDEWRSISHNNKHHRLSIGDHMIEAYKYICDNTDDFLLQIATYMHDCGKPFTKKFEDSKGNKTESAHFYQHHCCGSYNSLFYLKDMFKEEWMKFKIDEILYVSLLIELHMRPFLSWDKSEKAKEKDRKLFGDNIINSVMLVHEADLAAH